MGPIEPQQAALIQIEARVWINTVLQVKNSNQTFKNIMKSTQHKYISFHRQLQSQHRSMEMTSRADVTIERGETRDFNVTDSLEVRNGVNH